MAKFKLHIRGPHVPLGGMHSGLSLWLCYDPDNVHKSVSATSPMIAYRTWYAIYGIKPE